jgi:hypothetical protein
MKPIHKLALIFLSLMVPYFVLAFILAAGKQTVSVWVRIALSCYLFLSIVVLAISRKVILRNSTGKPEESTAKHSRTIGVGKLLLAGYVVTIPVTLIIIVSHKKPEGIPGIIVQILVAIFLWRWLSRAKQVQSQGSGGE